MAFLEDHVELVSFVSTFLCSSWMFSIGWRCISQVSLMLLTMMIQLTYLWLCKCNTLSMTLPLSLLLHCTIWGYVTCPLCLEVKLALEWSYRAQLGSRGSYYSNMTMTIGLRIFACQRPYYVMKLIKIFMPHVLKKYTRYYPIVPIIIWVCCILFEFAHGSSLYIVNEMFGVGWSTTSSIIQDVVQIVNVVLRDKIALPAGRKLVEAQKDFENCRGHWRYTRPYFKTKVQYWRLLLLQIWRLHYKMPSGCPFQEAIFGFVIVYAMINKWCKSPMTFIFI